MRIRHPRRWLIATGFAAYVVFLLATLPASWLAYAVARGSANQVVLVQARGSAWSGRARLVVDAPAANPVYLGTLTWNLSPWRLVALSLHARIRLRREDDLARATLDLRRSGLVLSTVRADLDASHLGSVVPAASLFGLGGRIVVHSPMLRLIPGRLAGNARVEWNDARISSLGARPFGSYRANLTTTRDSLHMDLQSATGALRLRGTGSWSPFTSGKMDFQGSIETLNPDRIPATMLSMIGNDAGGGRRSIRFHQTRRLPWFTAARQSVAASATSPSR
jgi:general secretion pathway protein N